MPYYTHSPTYLPKHRDLSESNILPSSQSLRSTLRHPDGLGAAVRIHLSTTSTGRVFGLSLVRLAAASQKSLHCRCLSPIVRCSVFAQRLNLLSIGADERYSLRVPPSEIPTLLPRSGHHVCDNFEKRPFFSDLVAIHTPESGRKMG